MYRVQMEPSECIEISIWRKCPECKGLGARIVPGESVNIVVVPREVCTWCHGFGRQATFIPIDQLANPDSGIDPLALVRAIKDWVLNQPEQTAGAGADPATPSDQPEPPTMVCPKCGGGGGTTPWDPLSDLKCDQCKGSGLRPGPGVHRFQINPASRMWECETCGLNWDDWRRDEQVCKATTKGEHDESGS